MPTTQRPRPITVLIDDPEIADLIRQLATDRGKTPRQIVAEALRQWIELIEDLEDIALADEARRHAEPTITPEEYARKRGWIA
ncbi:MAG: hypothetical protein HY675_23795 [Chloroflexi bacterium]|nr:hypothetical protein [Chloroflexota bacterium]